MKASNTGEAGTADTFGDGDQFGVSMALSDDGNTLAVGAHLRGQAAASTATRTTTRWRRPAPSTSSTAPARPGRRRRYVKATESGRPRRHVRLLRGAQRRRPHARGRQLRRGRLGRAASTAPYDNGAQRRGRRLRLREGQAGTWMQQAYIQARNAEGGRLLRRRRQPQRRRQHAARGLARRGLPRDRRQPDASRATTTRRRTSPPAPPTSSSAAARTWTQQAFFKPSNTGANDWFGSRLVLSGDGNTAAIGAPLEDSAARASTATSRESPRAGAVYLFGRSGTTWRQAGLHQGRRIREAFDQFGGVGWR